MIDKAWFVPQEDMSVESKGTTGIRNLHAHGCGSEEEQELAQCETKSVISSACFTAAVTEISWYQDRDLTHCTNCLRLRRLWTSTCAHGCTLGHSDIHTPSAPLPLKLSQKCSAPSVETMTQSNSFRPLPTLNGLHKNTFWASAPFLRTQAHTCIKVSKLGCHKNPDFHVWCSWTAGTLLTNLPCKQ